MIESLLITLREGIEAALVVGVILAYLNRTGKLFLRRMVYLGLGAGVAASAAFAFLFQIFGVDPENEYLEGALLGIAGVMVASLVLWMWRAGKHVSKGIELKLAAVVGKEERRTHAWGLLFFTFLVVFREGAETVLFLIAATLGEFGILNLMGGIIGIGLATLFAVLFIQGSLRINLSRFFTVTSLVLLLLALKLVLGSVHEFAEVGAIPMSKDLMGLIGYFVRDNSSTAILMALLGAPILMILWDARRKIKPQAVSETAVERRKHLAARQQDRVWRIGLVIAALFVMLALGSTVVGQSSLTDPEPVAVTAVKGEVKIPISELLEERLHKYVHNSNGVNVRFLVVRHADGSLSTALDACQICGKVGYGQEGSNAICKNCNAPILMTTIGQGGGCNPLPLVAEVKGEHISIPVDNLVQAESIFR